MFFGVVMSPVGWLIALIVAFGSMFIPIIVIQSIADYFSEPWRMIISLVGVYVLWPVCLTWIYKRKLRNSGRGSIIFYLYVFLYLFIFACSVIKLFMGQHDFQDILGVFVIGSVSGYLVYFAFKARKKVVSEVENLQAEKYEAERSEHIQRQAEAILLAEKLKNHSEKP